MSEISLPDGFFDEPIIDDLSDEAREAAFFDTIAREGVQDLLHEEAATEDYLNKLADESEEYERDLGI
jgi:hypothetical protein